MYPVVFRLGGFEITSFGVLVALAALVGLWMLRRELRRDRLPDAALDAGIVGLIGGLLGAKLLWTVEHAGESPLFELLVNRGGMSWFGGFAGGLLAAAWIIHRKRLPFLAIVAAAAPALVVGHAIGRVGCFLVGDDYGTPSTLPWAVAFPQGLPPTMVRVHPTQLYEAVALVPLVWWLLRLRRKGSSDMFVVGAYLAATGALRFGIEFIRVNERVVGELSLAHVASLLALATGVVLLVASKEAHHRVAYSSSA